MTSHEVGFPSKVELDLKSSARHFWLARARQHTTDSYAGVRMAKFPEDLRTYEHLLWQMRANVVIEIGTRFGGSALWFRDRLRTMRAYGRIACLSRRFDRYRPEGGGRGCLRRRSRLRRDDHLPGGGRSGPSAAGAGCTAASAGRAVLRRRGFRPCLRDDLRRAAGFARFVPTGGYLVVEDGCVDVEEMRLNDSWPRGVLPAVADWLASTDGEDFRVRRDLELYGMTCHPGGFLQRMP